MYLNDAVGRSKMRVIYCHHEQACAMAADGYARIAGKPAAVIVTGGPGGINALNGVFGAYTDSVPMVVVSGQSKKSTLGGLAYSSSCSFLRQLGDQEVNIVKMAEGVTKWATQVRNEYVNSQTAVLGAVSGRPGPVWIDVPVDVQALEAKSVDIWRKDGRQGDVPVQEINKLLAGAKRPVILAGSGVRISGAVGDLKKLAELTDIPVVTAWACDAFPSDHPNWCGRQGTVGDYAGNWAVQNSDLLLILGSRLSIRQISYNWASFAPKAYKIWVDIDPAELEKPTIRPDLPVVSDIKRFMRCLSAHVIACHNKYWLGECRFRASICQVVKDKHRKDHTINPYHFIEILSSHLEDDEVVVTGDATACISTFQALPIRAKQRLISNSGSASMGWCLPAAIGAAAAHGKRVTCITGDGSIMQNIQELATIAHYNLPIRIFVMDNGGYASIKSSQQRHFGSVYGAGKSSGVGFANAREVAESFGIKSSLAVTPREIAFMGTPSLVQMLTDRSYEQEPRLESKRLPDGTMETASLDSLGEYHG
ncbi:hypothetical protein AYO40_03485 [Planctomycetaceae bacterium SCGC AG-212-D15]|nr:hypothetical protein AYO40_03485 [Planctomycetaceae bacterium SCGC AG-212-D15]